MGRNQFARRRLFVSGCSNNSETTVHEPAASRNSAQFSQEQRVSLEFDRVGDENGARFFAQMSSLANRRGVVHIA